MLSRAGRGGGTQGCTQGCTSPPTQRCATGRGMEATFPFLSRWLMVSFYHEPLFSRPNPPLYVHVHSYWPWWAENHLQKSVDLCYIVICMGLYTRKACSSLSYFCWHQHISSFVFDFRIVKMAFVIFMNMELWTYNLLELCSTATRDVAVLLRTFTWASTPCAESASLARVSACTC